MRSSFLKSFSSVAFTASFEHTDGNKRLEGRRKYPAQQRKQVNLSPQTSSVFSVAKVNFF